MSRTAATLDLQPIDRLEEKVRQLVGMIDTLRADRTKALDEVTRLERELDAPKPASARRPARPRTPPRCAKNGNWSARVSCR